MYNIQCKHDQHKLLTDDTKEAQCIRRDGFYGTL